MVEDRGHKIPRLREQWIKVVHSDGSGLDMFIRPSAVLAVTIDAADHSAATMLVESDVFASVDQSVQSSEDTQIHFSGDEAKAILDWLERNCGISAEATWQRA